MEEHHKKIDPIVLGNEEKNRENEENEEKINM